MNMHELLLYNFSLPMPPASIKDIKTDYKKILLVRRWVGFVLMVSPGWWVVGGV